MPAASKARSSKRPAGPTNGLPALSSASPGVSPTTSSRACLGPSPNTVWVPTFHRRQPRQSAAAARSFGGVGLGGMKSAAELVVFAVLLGFIVLFAVLVEPVMAGRGLTVDVDVARLLG